MELEYSTQTVCVTDRYSEQSWMWLAKCAMCSVAGEFYVTGEVSVFVLLFLSVYFYRVFALIWTLCVKWTNWLLDWMCWQSAFAGEWTDASTGRRCEHTSGGISRAADPTAHPGIPWTGQQADASAAEILHEVSQVSPELAHLRLEEKLGTCNFCNLVISCRT